jgi:hypothetical protein
MFIYVKGFLIIFAERAYFCSPFNGEVLEWLKRYAWKVYIPERVSRVRIPPSPLLPAKAFCYGWLFYILGEVVIFLCRFKY